MKKLENIGKFIIFIGIIITLISILINVEDLRKEMDVVNTDMLALATRTDAIIESTNTKIYEENFVEVNEKLDIITSFINTSEEEITEEEIIENDNTPTTPIVSNKEPIEPKPETKPEAKPEPAPAPQTEAEDNTESTEAPNGESTGTVFQLTAYTWTGNKMANGQYPYVGACASNYFPLGTILYIEGYGTYTVCDRGGMASNVIDIYMSSREECIQFGRRSALVTVVN